MTCSRVHKIFYGSFLVCILKRPWPRDSLVVSLGPHKNLLQHWCSSLCSLGLRLPSVGLHTGLVHSWWTTVTGTPAGIHSCRGLCGRRFVPQGKKVWIGTCFWLWIPQEESQCHRDKQKRVFWPWRLSAMQKVPTILNALGFVFFLFLPNPNTLVSIQLQTKKRCRSIHFRGFCKSLVFLSHFRHFLTEAVQCVFSGSRSQATRQTGSGQLRRHSARRLRAQILTGYTHFRQVQAQLVQCWALVLHAALPRELPLKHWRRTTFLWTTCAVKPA